MPASVLAFADIGKSAKDLLAGSKAGGIFQLDPKISLVTTTSTGVTFTASAVQKNEKLDASLKAAYATKKYSLDAAVDPSAKVTVNGSVSGVAPGVKVTGSATLPDISTAKIGVEYANPYVNLKSTVSATASPVLEASAASGYKSFVVGGETAYDTSKSTLTKYNFGLGYHAPDFQVAAFVTDKLSNLKVAYSHNIAKDTTVGAEVTRSLASSDYAFALAYARKLQAGCLTKAKLDSKGVLSLLYETKLAGGEKVAGSMQLLATDFSKPPKYGFALDLTA